MALNSLDLLKKSIGFANINQNSRGWGARTLSTETPDGIAGEQKSMNIMTVVVNESSIMEKIPSMRDRRVDWTENH